MGPKVKEIFTTSPHEVLKLREFNSIQTKSNLNESLNSSTRLNATPDPCLFLLLLLLLLLLRLRRSAGSIKSFDALYFLMHTSFKTLTDGCHCENSVSSYFTKKRGKNTNEWIKSGVISIVTHLNLAIITPSLPFFTD
jgi:hypothetical protein